MKANESIYCVFFFRLRFFVLFTLPKITFVVVAEKSKAQAQAASLEEKLKALEQENASLKLAADEEKSGKDRLLALVHSLTGLLLFPIAWFVFLTAFPFYNKNLLSSE